MTHPTPAPLSTVHARIRSVRADGLGVITLARPVQRNALDRETAVELVSSLRELEAADDVRVVIMEGDGDDFCAGSDLAAMEATLDAGSDTHIDDARALGRVFSTMRGMSKPIVARPLATAPHSQRPVTSFWPRSRRSSAIRKCGTASFQRWR
jgi:enoyl-CoA hydratase/carnithine racemase